MHLTNQVVVMPCQKRPEMLALALRSLEQSRRPANLDVRIFADTQTNLQDVEYVRDLYYPEAMIFHASRHTEAPSGCWNILNSIKQGYQTGAESIFLIEEDVMVRPNFFEWHVEQNHPNCVVSCGRKDRQHYPLYGPLYTNPGSCLRRSLVEKLLPHICDDFFLRGRAYLDEKFGLWDSQSYLDDGLIRRVIRQMDRQAVYPDTPVCAHQGFRFYNKLDLYMNYETEISRKITRLEEILRSIRPGDRYAGDFEI